MLGRLVKVTPSSEGRRRPGVDPRRQGVTADEFASRPEGIRHPRSVIGFFRGGWVEPAGGWVEPLRSRVLAGRREAPPEEPVSDDDKAALGQSGAHPAGGAEPPAVPRVPTAGLAAIGRSTATLRGCRPMRSCTACAPGSRNTSSSSPVSNGPSAWPRSGVGKER